MPHALPPRRLIVLAGPRAWGKQRAVALGSRSGLQDQQITWLEPEDDASGLLGQERAMLVLDTYHGLNPDVFGRVSGLIQAGGALLLICPPLDDWPDYPDPEHLKLAPYPEQKSVIAGLYLKRWVRLLTSPGGIERYTPENDASIPPIKTSKPDAPLSQACTTDQQRAIEAICKTVTGQRRRPAIISADRGRGKSAALGLAAGKLLTSGQAKNIIVTASGFKQVGSVFKHAQAILPDAEFLANRKCLQHAHGRLSYVAADSLISKIQNCDLLIVDEASTLGIARLEALLRLYPRIAFSGTEHGYEGSGRGFSLKFRQLIQAHSRGQHALRLDTPVRWANGDLLEYWTNRLLLLDVNQGETGVAEPVEMQELSFHEITQSELAENETLLARLFGLLIDAHYQTRPVDCRYLLDAPNSRLFVAEHGNRIIGLVWLMLEGGLEADIAREVVAGRRRPQGHLVPQILAAHLGLEAAITLRCARIQRIVVNPHLQGQGIGSWMLGKIEKQDDINVDYLASSFGADPPLSAFWQRAGYRTARISDKPQAASGLHSVVVLKPCSEAANSLSLQTLKLFRAQFVTQLASGLRNLSLELACSIAPQSIDKLDLDSGEIKTAVLFAYAQRPYESSLAVLAKLGQYALFNSDPEFEPGGLTRHLFVKRTLQNQPWSACSKDLNINGQRECVKQLRHGARAVLAHAFSEEKIAKLRKKYHS